MPDHRTPVTGARGRRVLDVSTDIAGLYAGRLLARHGFEVTRTTVDDPAAVGSMVFDGSAADTGSAFRRHLDRGTRRVTVDRDDLDRAVGGADVVLSTFGPGAAGALGLDAGTVRRRNPGATLVSVTPYGLTGLRADRTATEKTLFAHAGAMFVSGDPAGPPFCPNLPIPSVLGGVYAAMAVVLDRIGGRAEGRAIDLALVEILAANTERVLSWYSYLEAVPHRGVGGGRLEQASGGGFLRAVDGFFYVFSGYQWFDKVAQLVSRPELVEGDGADPTARRARAAEADRIVAEAVAALPVAELARRAQDLRMPSGPVNTVASLLDDPQLASRGAFTEPAPGELEVEEPYRFVDGPPAPATSQRRAASGAGGPDLPLAGVRVLDLTHAFAGPTSSRILAEAGAEVLKIESVSRLDVLARGMLPYDNDTSGDWWDRSAYYGERNLGKRSLTLDMASPVGRDLFLRLLAGAEVVVANFTRRVLRGWGLGPEALLDANPGAVVLMMTGFGMDGPKADNPALAGTMEAASGFSSLVRADDDQPPGALGFNFGDMASGVSGAAAVLFALDRRRRTGRGQIIDFACAEAPLPFLAAQILERHVTGREPSCRVDPFHAGRHVLIEAGDGAPGQRWVLAYVPPGREDGVAAGDGDLGLVERGGAALTSPLSRAKVLAMLEDRGILAVPLADAEDLWFDAGLRERGLFAFATRRTMPTLPYARALPGRWDGAPLGSAVRAIPTLGDSNWAVLGEGLGVPVERFAGLELEGVTGSRPVGRLPRTFQVPLALDDLEAADLVRRVDGARSRLVESFDPGADDALDESTET